MLNWWKIGCVGIYAGMITIGFLEQNALKPILTKICTSGHFLPASARQKPVRERSAHSSPSGDIFAALCCAMLCYAMHCKKLILYLLQTMHCLAMLWMIVGKAILGLRMTWMEAS